MSAEREVLDWLAKTYPSLAALEPAELARRAEAIGVFAAQTWGAGPEGLKQRGVDVPPELHASLAQGALRIAQSNRGGVAMLVQLRTRLGDDARFGRVFSGLGALFARRPAGTATPAPAPPTQASPPPAAPAPQVDFVASVLGSGLAPVAAPPPRPAAPPPPPKATVPPPPKATAPAPARPAIPASAKVTKSASSASFAEALASGELDLLDEPSAPTPAAPRLPAAPVPAAPRAAAPSDGLDLLPDEAAPSSSPGLAALSPELDPTLAGPAPSADTKRPAGKSGPVIKGKVTAAVKEFSLDEDKKENEEEEEDKPPPDPALAALWRWERNADMPALNEARKLYERELAAAPSPAAAASAEASVARVYLAAGDDVRAGERARAALQKDPQCSFALEVLLQLACGDAERAKLAVALAGARVAIQNGDAARARQLMLKARDDFPSEPHVPFVLAYLAKLADDKDGFERSLLDAWSMYPSIANADLPLGGDLDDLVSSALVGHGRQLYKTGNPEILRQTVEGVDDKTNVVSGSLRLGIAIARVGLVHANRRIKKRRLLGTIGAGLIGLQYYDQAIETYSKAAGMIPGESEAKVFDNERRFASAQRRAFDKPGIKAQLGKYKCLSSGALAAACQHRLEQISKEAASKQEELSQATAEIGDRLKDPDCRANVKAVSMKAGVALPIDSLDGFERELAEIAGERARLGAPGQAPAKPAAGGFFSKISAGISAAASGMATAAKEAQLKLKEQQVQSRMAQAIKDLARKIATELGDAAFSSDRFQELVKNVAAIEAGLEACAEEEKKVRKKLDTLSDS